MLSRTEVDGHTITIPSAKTKNKLPHMLPLPPLARDILQSVKTQTDLYFTGKRGKPIGPWSRIKAQLDSAMKPDRPWRLHDLRRTVSTGMNALGIAPATVEAVLNHQSGTRNGVAGTYNRHSYLPGNVSFMWIERRLESDPDFPRPDGRFGLGSMDRCLCGTTA